MIILGIDPGTAIVGYGIVEKNSLGLSCLGYGCIETAPSSPPEKRLEIIYDKLNKIIKKYKPSALSVENVYFFKNVKTAMPVSQSKGVIMLAAAKKKLPVYEITPLQVKMAVTGYGRANKKQIQKMIAQILKLKKIPSPDDAADALSIAVSCANIISFCEKKS